MSMPDIKVPHIGRKIERLREMKGMKQETLASKIGVSQQTISRIESSEQVEEDKLKQIAAALDLTVEAIKDFNEEGYFNNYNSHHTFNDSSSMNNNFNCTFNPIDKIMELVDENKKLYQQLLKEKETVIEILQELRKSS